MKLNYKTRDILTKVGFTIMLLSFVLAVGYSYVECHVRIISEAVSDVMNETPKNLENAIKVKMK
jgi:hypothetical protein